MTRVTFLAKFRHENGTQTTWVTWTPKKSIYLYLGDMDSDGTRYCMQRLTEVEAVKSIDCLPKADDEISGA